MLFPSFLPRLYLYDVIYKNYLRLRWFIGLFSRRNFDPGGFESRVKLQDKFTEFGAFILKV